jgi:hypothetical protein
LQEDFAFHRYIYKPFKEGTFSGGLHHKLATVKAALAAAFAYHKLKLAMTDARSTKILSALLSPILSLQTKLAGLNKNGLRNGTVDPAAIESANGNASAISAQSASRGQSIQDQPTPQLGG